MILNKSSYLVQPQNQSGDLTGRLCKQSGLGTTGFVFCNDQKKAAESGGQYCLYSQPSGKGYSVDTCSDWEKKKKEEEQKKAIEEAIKSDSKTYYYANGIYVKNGKELCIAYAAFVGKENHGASSSGSSFICGVSTTVGTRTTVHQELQSDTAIRVTLAGALAKYSGDNGGCTAYFSGENTISCLKDSSGVGGDSSGEESSDSESEKPKEEEQEQEEDNPVVNMLANLYNMMKEEMTGLKNAITSSSSGGGSAGSENGSKNGSENGSDEGSETGAENATGDSDYGVLDGVSKSEYSRGGVFQESGSCPSPIPLNFSVLGYGVATEFSFEHVCTVVAKLRPLMIMFGYLVGATMITKALRSS